jgi:hypothetical protein
MELTLDIFKNDAFSTTTLQRVVKNTPYIPTMLGQMGLFTPKPILTKEVLLYEEDGAVRFIPITERGAPDIQQVRDQGRLRALSTSRLSKKDTVRAGELLGVANMALPEEIRLRNAVELVNERTQQLKTDLEATKELHRFGGLQGKLVTTREDGTSYIVNFFTEYGIAEPAAININFSTTTEENAMMFFQENFLQPMLLSLKNRATMSTRVGALCGDGFWGKLMRHPAVREFYKLQQTGAGLALGAAGTVSGSNLWGHVYFAGIDFYHFRGSTNGEIAVPTNDAIMFPIGANDVFNVYWSPGETLLDVAEKGQPEYLYVQPDVREAMPEFVDIVVRAYPLYACIYPSCLMRATATG